MKLKLPRLLVVPVTFIVLPFAHAADNTWTNAAANLTWDESSANWAAPSAWVNGDAAIFGATGIGAISVSPGVSANKITFNNNGYSLVGGPLTLVGPEIATASGTDTTISSVLQGSAGLTKSGAGTLRLTGTNSYTGTTLMTGGSLLASNSSGHAFTGNVTLGDDTAEVTLTTTQANQFGGSSLTFANAGRNAKLQLRGTTQTVTGLNSASSNILSIIQNDEAGSAGYVAGGGSGTLIVNNSSASLFDGIIRNGGGAGDLGVLNLTKTGSGTLTILNTTTRAGNSYSGTTTVSEGLLQFGNETATRKGIGSGPLQIDAAGSALLWYANGQTHTNTISGSGKLNFRSNNSASSLGFNEHIITGTANSGYSGAITVIDSRLRLQTAASPLGDASAGNTVTMIGNGQLMYNAAGTYNYHINIGELGYYEGGNLAGQQLGALRLELGAVQAGTVTLTGNAGIGTQDAAGVISGEIRQSGGSYGFTKLGANRLTLTANNSYTGTTMVKTGTLALSGLGSIAASTTIEVAAGATLDVSGVAGGWTLGSGQTLKGNGTIIGNLTLAGVVASGTSIGTLTTTDSVTLAASSEWQVELAGAAIGQYDRLITAGTLDAGGLISLTLLDGFEPSVGDQFDIADFGAFSDSGYTFDVAAAPLSGDLEWDFSNFQTSGLITVIPEPTSFLLAACAAPLLLRRRRAHGSRRRD
jgi:fibronectin-binding autotransporter adhesin